ncbi:MAG: hypothetical protein FJ216_06540 [Ignavibacteria bacterium]|nr:hypothetical protein [Ignavibacteria bacterium]
MKPNIDNTSFGSITIEGEVYERDIIVNLKGNIKKRKKKLSKEIYGTSHIVSREEAKHIFKEGAEILIVGTGQHGTLNFSEEAMNYFKKKNCKVVLLPTPEAIKEWNTSSGKVIAMFHITC